MDKNHETLESVMSNCVVLTEAVLPWNKQFKEGAIFCNVLYSICCRNHCFCIYLKGIIRDVVTYELQYTKLQNVQLAVLIQYCGLQPSYSYCFNTGINYYYRFNTSNRIDAYNLFAINVSTAVSFPFHNYSFQYKIMIKMQRVSDEFLYW